MIKIEKNLLFGENIIKWNGLKKNYKHDLTSLENKSIHSPKFSDLYHSILS